MKKTLLVLALALLATPSLVRAHVSVDDDNGGPNDNHESVNATEMAGIGIAGAALLGIAGYLILRKRNAST